MFLVATMIAPRPGHWKLKGQHDTECPFWTVTSCLEETYTETNSPGQHGEMT